MNKRIREVVRKLSEQAYVEHRQEYFSDYDDPTITSVSVTRHFDREKFAELIVRECIEQIKEQGTDCMDWAPSQLGIRPEYVAMAEHIKQHFGVE